MAEVAEEKAVEVGEREEATTTPDEAQEKEDKLQDITLFILPLHLRRLKGMNKYIGRGSSFAPEKYRASREVQHWAIQVNNKCYEVTSIYKESTSKHKDKDKKNKDENESENENEDDEEGEVVGIGLVISPAEKWWKRQWKKGVAPAEWGIVGRADKSAKELDDEANWIWNSFKKTGKYSYKPFTKNCHMFAYLFVARVAVVKAAKDHKNKVEKWWKTEMSDRDARESKSGTSTEEATAEDTSAHPHRDRIIHRMPLPISHTLTELCAAAFTLGLSSSIHQIVGSQLPVLATAHSTTATTTVLGTSAGKAGAVGSAKATTIAGGGAAKGGIFAGGAKATTIAGGGAAKGGMAAAGGKAAVAGVGASKMAAAGAAASTFGKGAMFVHPVAGAATVAGGAGLVYFGNRRRKKRLAKVEKIAQENRGSETKMVKVEEAGVVAGEEDDEKTTVIEAGEEDSDGEETSDSELDSTDETDVEVSPEAAALAAEIEKELQADLEEKLALEGDEEMGPDGQAISIIEEGQEGEMTAEPESIDGGTAPQPTASRSDTNSSSTTTRTETASSTGESLSTATTSMSSMDPIERTDSSRSDMAKQRRDELFSKGKKLFAKGNEKRLAFQNARTASNS